MAKESRSALVADGAVDAIYLTYDGLLDPLGQSQVLPYVLYLARSGRRIEIVSFEKKERDSPELRRQLRDLLASVGVRWTALRYHRRPRVLSTAFDLSVGTWIALKRTRSGRAALIHARSYVPAAIGMLVKWLLGVRLLFDMRGFWPEERVELGIFRSSGALFRCTKIVERWLLRHSDRIVVLTRKAREQLSLRGHDAGIIEVIPCCVDPSRYGRLERPSDLAARYGLAGRIVVGNIGAAHRTYLLDEMFRFVAALTRRGPGLKFVYLTSQDSEIVRSRASAYLDSENLLVACASPDEVPQWLGLFQLGIYFLKPCYATSGASPTKLGEFLAAGVPVVTNSGVGDVDEIFSRHRIGVLLPDLTEEAMEAAADEVSALLPPSESLRRTCREAAEQSFSLEKGGAAYLSLYQSLIAAPERPLGSPGEVELR